MKQPTLELTWTSKRMMAVTQALHLYWADKVGRIEAQMERMGPGDERYLGMRKKLERELANAREHSFVTGLFVKEVLESAKEGRETWPISTDELPWFFPQEAPDSA